MILVDLYSEKYEGELEAILIEKDDSDQIMYKLRLFQADFNIIIDWIPYNETSHPENLVRLINIDLYWGQDFSQILRLQEFYDQLLLVATQIDPFDLNIFNAIKNICESTLCNKNRLFIKLDI